jgi:hypothetical protein
MAQPLEDEIGFYKTACHTTRPLLELVCRTSSERRDPWMDSD